jgi:hypothetical protein
MGNDPEVSSDGGIQMAKLAEIRKQVFISAVISQAPDASDFNKGFNAGQLRIARLAGLSRIEIWDILHASDTFIGKAGCPAHLPENNKCIAACDKCEKAGADVAREVARKHKGG